MTANAKRVFVAFCFVLSMPLCFMLALMLADFVYMRYVFEGDIKDFAPGDAIGIFFHASLFAPLLLLLMTVFWIWIYRRLRG